MTFSKGEQYLMRDFERRSIGSIRYWLAYQWDYPDVYKAFFIQWMLFNSYYSKYKAGDKKGVIKFGREHGDPIWESGSLTGVAREIAKVECVGDGKGKTLPHLEVISATVFLRTLLGIEQVDDTGAPDEQARICLQVCREVKRRKCLNLRFAKWADNPASALLRIVYQIRCNLFHGDKLEYDGPEAQRNMLLVNCGRGVLDEVLKYISALEPRGTEG
jgi:hypothetical protein